MYTSADILAHPSVQLTRGGLILIGLLSGGDYHQAGLPCCGPGIAHGLAKCGLGDELLKAVHSLSRDELPDFLTAWREDLRAELRTNAHGHLGSEEPPAVPDTFPDIDVLLSYTNPIISATDAGARCTHTPPKWEREPDLGKLAHLCELHFEWGLKDIIIKRFRTIIWPSIVLRVLRRSALETPTDRRGEPLQDVFGTPSNLLIRRFSSMGFSTHDTGGEGDSGLRDLIVKIHSSRTHAYTDSILEYRLEVAPAQLVRLASAGIQGLPKPTDTTYDVLPSESEDESGGDLDDTGRRRKKRGVGPPPEPDSHLRVWMPACIVRLAHPELVERYETGLEAKCAKKSNSKQPATTKTKSAKKEVAKPSVPHVDSDAEEFDLNVSCSSEDRKEVPHPLLGLVLGQQSAPNIPTPSTNAPLRDLHSSKFDISTSDEDAPSEKLKPPLSSPSKVLQRLDPNLNPVANLCGAPPPPSSSSLQGLFSALRSFPMASEEEESSEDENCYPSAAPFVALRTQLRASTPPPPPRSQLIPREEEELSSGEDPDMVIADLPVLVDTRDLSPEERPGGSTHQTLPQRGASRYHPFPLQARTDEGRIVRAQGAIAETPVISISSGGSDDDDDDNGLMLAPLLVARSRTLLPQRVAATGWEEVIDLT